MVDYKRPNKITTLWAAYDLTVACSPTWSNGSDYATNRRACIRHIHEAEGSDQIKLKDINQPWLRAVLEQYAEDRAERGLETAPATLNQHIRAIRHVLKTTSQEGFLNAMPVFKEWSTNSVRTNYYTKEQVLMLTAFAAERDDLPMADIIKMAAFTGMRQGELLKLRVRDVDWVNQCIHIGGTAETQTKARNYRTVGIHDSLLTALEERTRGRERMGFIFDEFPNRKQLLRRYYKCRDRLIHETQNLIDKSYVFHTLRHTYGTLMIQAGTPLTDLRDLMGHSTVSVTERYLHTTHDRRLQLANVI